MTGSIVSYLRYLKTLGRSEATCTGYGSYLRKFQRFARTDAITRSHVERFQDHIIKESLAEGTRRGIRIVLSGFLKWMYDNRKTLSDLSRHVHHSIRKDPKVKTPLSESEVQEILEALTPDTPFRIRGRAMLELMYASGLRRGEILSLRKDGLDRTRKTVTVKGKGGKTRTVPVGDVAIHHLERYLEIRKSSSPLLFTFPNGQPVTRHGLESLFAWINRRSQKHVHPHLLRHSFAVHMLRNGADVRVLQALLGHENIDVTARYLGLVKEDLKLAYDEAMEGVL